MNNSHILDLKHSKKILKQIWSLGRKHILIIDESIIPKLRINDHLAFLEQMLRQQDHKILIRIKKIQKSNKK